MEIRPKLVTIRSIDDAPELEGYRRTFRMAETGDAALNVARQYKSPIAYYLRRARRVYVYTALTKQERRMTIIKKMEKE